MIPKYLGALAVAVVAAVTFAFSIANGFVFDDVRIVVEQTQLHSLSNFFEIISSPWWSDALYRPVTKLSFALDWAVSDGAAWYFHAINVLLHVAATLVVYALALRWLDVFGATIGAALFAAHPVHVEAVASVVGRAEILVGLFAALAALAYRWDGILASYDDRSWRRYLASGGTLLTLVLGLGSKENALVIPGVLLLVDWMEARSKNVRFDARFKSHWILWVATLALALEWMWFRAELLGGFAGDDPAPGLEGAGLIGRALIMAPIVLQYLRLLVFPLHLSADYSPDFVSIAGGLTPLAIAGFTVLVVAVVITVVSAQRAPLVTFGLLWIGGALLIVANVIVPTGILLAERTLYLPSIGLVFVVGYLVTLVPRNRTTPLCIVASALVALGVMRSAYRVPVFKNDASFYPRFAADAPGSFRSLWISGMMAYTINDRQLGERLLREALVVFPLYPNVWHDFGRRLQEDERWNDAAQAFSIAFNLDSTRTYDAANAVSNFVTNGNLDSAKTYAARAARLDPFHPRVKGAFGAIATAEGRPLEAMTFHRQAAWLEPDEPIYWYRAARAALDASFCPTALTSIRHISALDRSFPNLATLQRDADSLGCQGTDNERP